MPDVEVSGARLAYRRGGPVEGPALVFVHGLGGSTRSWETSRKAAESAGYDAIAIDCRGAGESEKPPGPYSVEGWAADVVGVLDDLGIERVALAGHSVGCMVAEHAALALGGRATGLAVLGGALAWAPGFDEVLDERARLARTGRIREVAEAVAEKGFSARAHAERPEAVAEFVAAFAANDPEGYALSALAAAGAQMRSPGELRCPVLALAGSEDVVTPLAAAAEIAAAVPSGHAAVIDGGAHWCNVELGESVAAILLDFLREPSTG